MKQNILLFHDTNRDETQSLKSSCSTYSFVSYLFSGDSTTPVVSDAASLADTSRMNLSTKLKQLFKEMEVQSK